jgi:hypothetical protein
MSCTFSTICPARSILNGPYTLVGLVGYAHHAGLHAMYSAHSRKAFGADFFI